MSRRNSLEHTHQFNNMIKIQNNEIVTFNETVSTLKQEQDRFDVKESFKKFNRDCYRF